MTSLIAWLKKLAGLASESDDRSGTSVNLPPLGKVLDETVVKELMHIIEQTHENEYTCEETFAILDEYVEMVNNKQDAAALLPLVKRHIDLCVDCRDHYETLQRILQGDASSPAA